MNAHVVSEDATSVTVPVTIPFNGSMLESEAAIQEAVNEAAWLRASY